MGSAPEERAAAGRKAGSALSQKRSGQGAATCCKANSAVTINEDGELAQCFEVDGSVTTEALGRFLDCDTEDSLLSSVGRPTA